MAWLALACSGDPKPSSPADSGGIGEVIEEIDIIAFDLTVSILLPLNQSNLFDNVSSLDVIVEQEGGQVGRWSLEDIARGALDRADGLPALDAAVISLEGYDADGALVAFGRSAEVSIEDGEGEVSILVARADAMGWLSNLSVESAATAIAADGAGGVLMFGGTDRNVSGSTVRGKASDSVRRLDLGRPEDGLVFSTVGTMVHYPSSVEDPGRAGHSATRLGGTHENRDLILVAGGSTDFHDASQITDHAFLWDPSVDTAYEGGEFSMGISIRHHRAVADAAGNVVLSGGAKKTSEDNVYSAQNDILFFDGTNLQFTIIEPPSSDFTWIHHAGAAFGERGTLLCGGFVFPGLNPDFQTVDACGIVNTSGRYLSQSESGIKLPVGLLHHAMIGLSDGSVLVTGGATYSDGVYAVTNGAWVLSADGATWTDVGPMHLPRAMHSMSRLPDGRVLVVGGASEIDTHFWHGDNAIACAEVFNPELGDFVQLSTCAATDPDGALPEAVVMPAITVEQTRGIAVVAGGLNRGDQGATGAAIYLPPSPN
jgi:hypothetical protein